MTDITDILEFMVKWKKVIFLCLILHILTICIVGIVSLTKWNKKTETAVTPVPWQYLASTDKTVVEELTLKGESYIVGEYHHEQGTYIPKIIHQQWPTQSVPCRYHDNMHSFIERNPDYEYYLWTDLKARALIKERHNYLLDMFDNVVDPNRRANMIKYVVLYEYGGIYADLDTKCIQNLDRVSTQYSCILVPEAYEHSILFYHTELSISNSVMLCKAHHPFLKRVLTDLPYFDIFAVLENANGSPFLTYQLNQYKKENISDSIQIASSHLLRRQLDPGKLQHFNAYCESFASFDVIRKKGCIALLNGHHSRHYDTQVMFINHSIKYDSKNICRSNIENVIQKATASATPNL